MPALHPVIKWAQRKRNIFITLEIRDIVEERVNLTKDRLDFYCKSETLEYEFTIDFFEPIVSETSKWSKTGFHFILIINKEHIGKAYWPRLVKASGKHPYIQCDWDKWVD